MRFLGPQELFLILLIVLLLFGAARLPKLARSMREARDEFQKGSSDSGVPEAHTANPEPAATDRAPTPNEPTQAEKDQPTSGERP